MSTIFGGDTGMSYEDVQRKRKIAEALLAQNMRTPQNLPEGLNAIGRALAARSIEKKTGKAMEGLNAEADALFGSIFGGGSSAGGGFGGGYGGSAPMGDIRTESQTIADDAMAAIGKEPRGWNYDVPQEFVNSLVGMESGGKFDAVGPETRHGRALGFGQVMPANVRAWSKEILGREITPEEFMANPDLQKQIVYGKLNDYWNQTGGSAQDVASLWHSGVPLDQAIAQGRRDVNMSTKDYAAKVAGGYGGGGSGGGSPSVQQIAAALSNPIIRNDPGKVAILNAMLGKAMQASEPVRGVTMGDRLVNPMTGEVMADFSGEDGGAGNTDFSLTPQYVTNPDGTLGMIQLGKDGSVNVVELPEGLALQKGVEKLDLGTAFQWYNTVTGEPIGEPIPKDIEGEEAAKARGKAQGDADAASKIGAPKVIAKSTETVNLIDSILNNPNLDSIVGKFQGRLDPEGWGGLLMSQDQVDLAIKVKQLQGRAFMEAFETLKGGGQITEREGAAAQAAIARLQRVQGGPEYRKALNELRTIADNARRRAAGEQVPEYVPEAPAEPPADKPSRSSARVRYDAQGNRIP